MSTPAHAGNLSPIIPDADVWAKALSRNDPDPLIVHAFAHHVRHRRIFLVGWVRQALLARVRDDRQFHRLAWVLASFPDLPLLPSDHEHAAALTRRMRDRSVAASPWSSLLWAVAERLHGEIWSRERGWQTLADHGCPLMR
jgi:hypothetical protein